MFATLVFENGREPLRWSDVPLAVVSWLQDVGGWAAFAFVLWLLIKYARMRPAERARIPPWQFRAVGLLALLAAVFYAPLTYFWGRDLVNFFRNIPPVFETNPWSFRNVCLTAGGVLALAAVCLPIFSNLAALRPRRIWALTRLSFKEAIRNRVLYAFSALLLVFLFASWFVPYKPESQVRVYVQVVYWSMPLLLLLTAGLLAGFSIPTDIKNQTIHTIVTKPVERFEVFLGRFFGFVGLMTLVLVVMTTFSLLYVLRGVDPAAAAESLKARDPVYGDLHYEDVSGARADKAVNVGREWDYRSYICRNMPGQPQVFAVWEFRAFPNSLADRQRVRCEFGFDIYRTTKGQENRGVSCGFTFHTARFVPGSEDEYRRQRDALVKEGRPLLEAENELARKFGFYEVRAFEVADFHTQGFDVPGGLFQSALEPAEERPTPGREPTAPLRVKVAVNSPNQFVGMAKYDLYFRADDTGAGADNLGFAVNFYKGAFGLWLRLCMLTGLAVALSTYLSGVISWVVATVLYVCGCFVPFISSIAMGTAPEGGPFQSLVKLARREVSAGWVVDTTAARVATHSDQVFRWLFRRFLDLIPDVNRLDLTAYVAEGFNIPAGQVVLSLGLMVGYLLPWIILGFYLIRWREIASSQ
jgi:ABC-type transport system involved in multi-copper enzyme maturation permease subunit